MSRNLISAALIGASCLVLGSLVLNSFVTYAPSLKGWQIQNIYIRSILWHCGISAGLQIAGLALYITRPASKEARLPSNC